MRSSHRAQRGAIAVLATVFLAVMVTDNSGSQYDHRPTDGTKRLEDWATGTGTKMPAMDITFLGDARHEGGLSEESNSRLTLWLVK